MAKVGEGWRRLAKVGEGGPPTSAPLQPRSPRSAPTSPHSAIFRFFLRNLAISVFFSPKWNSAAILTNAGPIGTRSGEGF